MSTNNAINRLYPIPAFFAYLAATAVDATGDGVAVDPIIWDTTAYDDTSSYNIATGYFTAPVSGKYLVIAQVTLGNIGVQGLGYIRIYNSAGPIYQGDSKNTSTAKTADNQVTLRGEALTELAAGQTLKIYTKVDDGTQTVSIYSDGANNPCSYFCAYLIPG